MKFEWIAFDLDGTLIDTYEIDRQALIHSFKKIIGDDPNLTHFESILGRPFDERIAAILLQTRPDFEFQKEMQSTILERIRVAFKEFHDNNIESLVKPYDGVLSLISNLRSKGINLGIISSKRRGMGERELYSLGLLDFFTIRIFLQDVSEPKPSSDPVQRMMKIAGYDFRKFEDRTKFALVGDSIDDIQCAQKAGIYAIYAAWGSRSVKENQKIISQGKPEFVIHRPSQLLSILESNS